MESLWRCPLALLSFFIFLQVYLCANDGTIDLTVSRSNTAVLNLFFGFYLSHNATPPLPTGSENLHTIQKRLRDSLPPITQYYADMDANCLIRFCNRSQPVTIASEGGSKLDRSPKRRTTL